MAIKLEFTEKQPLTVVFLIFTLDIQEIIAFVILALAVAYLLRKYFF
jgi:hypothetical protein